MDKIIIKGAREHNLKNISLEIPKNNLVVFTGLSGSGKSSLAFDTIYAEGQRRYVESLSAYARQFLGIMDKPDVDSIEGLSPAISIDQKGASHNPRSTVGTITEIYDYLRLLYARIGHPHCPNCGQEIKSQSKEQITEETIKIIKKNPSKVVKILILSPVIKDRKGEYSELFRNLKQKGYQRVRVDKNYYGLDEDFVLIKTNKHTIETVVDRISTEIKNADKLSGRLMESIENALRLSEGEVIISEVLDASFEFPEKPKKTTDHLFSEKFSCPNCNISIPEIEPRTFSFNSPHGACQTCAGLGVLLKIDPALVLNPNLTIEEGGILPISRDIDSDTWYMRLIRTVAQNYDIPLNMPISSIPQNKINIILYGAPKDYFTVKGTNRFGRMTSYDTDYEGVIKNLERRYKETDSDFVRSDIERFMRSEDCPECHGTRLKKEALSVTIQNKSIAEATNMSIDNFKSKFINNISLSERESSIAKPILKELNARLNFLIDVGLNYLTLNRAANTLSGGEAQRIRLASQIGSGLSGVLYVLDEPSIGLHQKDNKKLITTLKQLRELGNTVIVVEHDKETMENADYLLDFGPGAGDHGGEIIAMGTPEEIKNNTNSLTGKYLSGNETINFVGADQDSPEPNKFLTIVGASEHNLKNITVELPIGKFIAVTGVSGSGKSTLIHDVLYNSMVQNLYGSKVKPGLHKGISGYENFDKVILIDQAPIGRTSRSNPATYTGAFSYIREAFSNTKEAKVRGYKPGRFSFNVKGGRCENCQGDGQIKIEMQFLPDVYVNCEVCHGKRYNNEALEIEYKSKNISDILEMTVEEALNFFGEIPKIQSKLEVLKSVGLDYIKLGQPAPTLSGGEAQRVKLATELAKKATGRTMYILDEPTTGLHFADLKKLLFVLKKLVSVGNTVIIIEHNLDIIKNADWIIDLGPEGGDKGGEVIAAGTPEEISKNTKSFTGQFLKQINHSC